MFNYYHESRDFLCNHRYNSHVHLIAVRELGGDISQLRDAEALFLFNHVSGGDLFLLNYVMGTYNIAKKSMTVMFYAMKWVCFGQCFINHDDIFVSLVILRVSNNTCRM